MNEAKSGWGEDKTFLPVGTDREVQSNFQLVAGTNRDLSHAVRSGRFRDDLLARINLWTFRLPGLRERPEDIEPNLDYELDRYAKAHGRRITFSREARDDFLRFATSRDAEWSANFRDFNAAVVRMATLAAGARITTATVADEIARLRESWATSEAEPGGALVERLLPPDRIAQLDRFERTQLEDALTVCLEARTLSEAGRRLFSASRTRRTTANDAERLRKYLARFGLSWQELSSTITQ